MTKMTKMNCTECELMELPVKVYLNKHIGAFMSVCRQCGNEHVVSIQEYITEQQNLSGFVDEIKEQEQIEWLLKECDYKYPPYADNKDVILAFRTMLEEGYEPTDREAFYLNYEWIMSSPVHEFETTDLMEMLDSPNDLYYDYGCEDEDEIDWEDINFEVRCLYRIGSSIYYLVC